MMKHFYLALSLLLIGNITLAGFPYMRYDNAIYATIQPGDLGLGIRYDHAIGLNALYGSFAKGSYKLPYGGYINDHIKTSFGVMYQLPHKFNNYLRDYISVGLTHHTFGERKYTDGLINENVFKPWSFELGCVAKVKRFSLCIRMDVLKWEGAMDFGFNF